MLSTEQQRLIEETWPLVRWLARNYDLAKSFPGVSLDDLISAGAEGLTNAAIYYKQKKGIKFATFATRIIRQKFNECIIEITSHGIRLPLTTRRQIAILKSKLGRFPYDREEAKKVLRKKYLSEKRFSDLYRAWLIGTNIYGTYSE